MGIKELDDALEYLYKNQRSYQMGEINAILSHSETGIKRDGEILIRKLVKDGYVTETQHPWNNEYYYDYIISIDGILFCEAGGYDKKLKRESTQIFLLSLEKWLIVAGTVLAGLYGLVEIVKWLCKSCN